MTRRGSEFDAYVIRWNMCEGGDVESSFGHECWKADISYEAVLSRGVAKMD